MTKFQVGEKVILPGAGDDPYTVVVAEPDIDGCIVVRRPVKNRYLVHLESQFRRTAAAVALRGIDLSVERRPPRQDEPFFREHGGPVTYAAHDFRPSDEILYTLVVTP